MCCLEESVQLIETLGGGDEKFESYNEKLRYCDKDLRVCNEIRSYLEEISS